MCSVLCSRCGGGGAGTCVRAALPKTLPVYSCGPSSARHGSRCVPVPGPVLPSPACSDHTHTTLCTCREERSRGDLASGHKQIILVKQFCIYTWDNLAKDVQSHYIRGPCLKQPNFNSKTYANNSKQHIYDGNACPEHRDVNWMVQNRDKGFSMSPPQPCEICYFA